MLHSNAESSFLSSFESLIFDSLSNFGSAMLPIVDFLVVVSSSDDSVSIDGSGYSRLIDVDVVAVNPLDVDGSVDMMTIFRNDIVQQNSDN